MCLSGFTYIFNNQLKVTASEQHVSRIQGENRFETASKISSNSFNSADTVIIANAFNFADALSGVPLAYQMEAPILVANGRNLDESVAKEIVRLGAENAIILGGEMAISLEIEENLKNLDLNIRRIAGNNRYETSNLIAKELIKAAPSNKAVVVDGMNFADAMSIGPFAAKKGMPIYLTRTNRLQNSKELDKYEKTYIIGGYSAVSEEVEVELNNPTRLAGLNRYETNAIVLNHFGINTNHLYVSTGLNFADALTGSVLAAQNNTGIALVRNNVSSILGQVLKKYNIQNYDILGGHMAVSDVLFDELYAYRKEVKEYMFQEEFQLFSQFNIDTREKDFTKLDYIFRLINVSSFTFFINGNEVLSSPYNLHSPLFVFFERGNSLFIRHHINWSQLEQDLEFKLEFTGNDGKHYTRNWVIDQEFIDQYLNDLRNDDLIFE